MNRIKELRQKAGIKQSELAQMLNLALSTMSSYETEKAQASIETYIQLADVFGVSLDYLFGRKEMEAPVYLPAPFPEISDRYSRLDDIDRIKAMAYIDGLLASEKYSSSQNKRAAG